MKVIVIMHGENLRLIKFLVYVGDTTQITLLIFKRKFSIFLLLFFKEHISLKFMFIKATYIFG